MQNKKIIKREDLVSLETIENKFDVFMDEDIKLLKIISDGNTLFELLSNESPLAKQERLQELNRINGEIETYEKSIDENDNNPRFIYPRELNSLSDQKSELDYDLKMRNFLYEYRRIMETNYPQYQKLFDELISDCDLYDAYTDQISSSQESAKDRCEEIVAERMEDLKDICSNETVLYFTAKQELESAGNKEYEELKSQISFNKAELLTGSIVFEIGSNVSRVNENFVRENDKLKNEINQFQKLNENCNTCK